MKGVAPEGIQACGQRVLTQAVGAGKRGQQNTIGFRLRSDISQYADGEFLHGIIPGCLVFIFPGAFHKLRNDFVQFSVRFGSPPVAFGKSAGVKLCQQSLIKTAVAKQSDVCESCSRQQHTQNIACFCPQIGVIGNPELLLQRFGIHCAVFFGMACAANIVFGCFQRLQLLEMFGQRLDT